MDEKIIIELNGIPGSGKTTVFKKIHSLLEGEFKVATLNDIYFYQEKNRFDKFKINIKIIFNRDRLLIILNLLVTYGFTIERLFDIMRFFKLNYQLNKYYEKETFDIILLEEGLIQYFASIPYLKQLKDSINLSEEIEKIIKPFKSFKVIHCDIPIDKSIKRIRERGFNDPEFKKRRVDALEIEEMREALVINDANLKVILAHIERSKKIKIKTDDTLDVIVSEINSFIS